MRYSLYSTHDTLQERVAQLEADLALVRELHDKDETDRALLENKLNALRVRRNIDKYVAKLERNWVALKTRVDTLHEIQDGNLDLPLVVIEAEAAANAAREALKQAQSGNKEDSSETDDSVGLSNDR